MACEEFARLSYLCVEAMAAEDRVRSRPARTKADLTVRDDAHSVVVRAENVLNAHSRSCSSCKADGRVDENFTRWQF